MKDRSLKTKASEIADHFESQRNFSRPTTSLSKLGLIKCIIRLKLLIGGF